MKGIGIVNMEVSALKSHLTDDKHNCISKEQENCQLLFTNKSNINSEVENSKKSPNELKNTVTQNYLKYPGNLQSGGQ